MKVVNNNQLVVVLIVWATILFGGQAFIEGTNMRTIVQTCKESK